MLLTVSDVSTSSLACLDCTVILYFLALLGDCNGRSSLCCFLLTHIKCSFTDLVSRGCSSRPLRIVYSYVLKMHTGLGFVDAIVLRRLLDVG